MPASAPRQPDAEPAPYQPERRVESGFRPRATGRWYILTTVFSLGMLAWVPMRHAAGSLNRPGLRLRAAGYGAGAAAVFALFAVVGSAPENAAGYPTNPVINALSFVMLGGFAGLLGTSIPALSRLRREVYRPGGPGQLVAPEPAEEREPGEDPAVAAVLAARGRRAEARKLVETDLEMARELRIGRPDLPREYDDGGLVDINGAPADAIAVVCDLDAATAERIVRIREGLGGAFSDVSEVLVLADVPAAAWTRLRDRAILMN